MRQSKWLLPVWILLIVFVSGGSTAAAAPSATKLSPFCTRAVVYAKSTPGTNLTTMKPATLETDYTRIKAGEPQMLALAPTSIRADLRKIFAFDNGLFAALAKAHWSFAKIPVATLRSWAVEGPKLKPASDAVIAYMDKACGLHYPLP